MDARTREPGAVAPPPPAAPAPERTVFAAIAAVSACHGLNDLIQSLLPAVYPILKDAYRLDYGRIGLITLVFQVTASLLQPLVGLYTDRHPLPFSLLAGMAASLCGLLLLAGASSYGLILLAAALIGIGSAVFHPEASRIARLAAGARPGLAQSLFQVGGNAGQAVGPLLAALVVAPRGQGGVAFFSLAALLAMAILAPVGRWYRAALARAARTRAGGGAAASPVSRRRAAVALVLLVLIVFSKNFYTAAFTSYYAFYLIERFGASVPAAQVCLFVFMAALAAGVVIGGPIGDRIGRRPVILWSVAGALPLTLLLPHVGFAATVALTVPIGLIIASSFPAMVVYAQELLPGRVGLVSGLLYGLSFGAGGLGAALLGLLADRTSLPFVYGVCAWLPALGLLALLLPRLRERGA